MFCMAGHFFCSSEAQFHGKNGCSWNVIAQRGTLQDFKSWRFLLFKRRWEQAGVERACASCFLEKKTRKRACVSRFHTSKTNTYVFPRRDIKSDCKRVCVQDVFLHLYTCCAKISTFGMCFNKNMETRMCILMKIPKWQGDAIVFPALITVVLGNTYVLKTHFFVFPQGWNHLKSVAVFPAQAHPNRCFCQNSSNFEIKS